MIGYTLLEGFHVEAARRLTGMHPWKVKGEWAYPHSADVLAAAHLQTILYYIQKCRHTVHNTIRDRDVLKEYRGAERRRGSPSRLFWVEQDMTEPVRWEYGEEGGEYCPPPDGVPRVCDPTGAAYYRSGGAAAWGHAAAGRGRGSTVGQRPY